MIEKNSFRGEKIQYKDGIGCCIWIPLTDNDDIGLGWDFDFDDIDDLIELLQEMKEVEAEIYD